VTQLDQMTQQNAALVEQSSAAAESLKVQAQQLVQAVAVFTLSPGGAVSASAGIGRTATPAKSIATKPAIATERRGANRAKNVVRPDFKAAAATPMAASPAKNGTDDWESF